MKNIKNKITIILILGLILSPSSFVIAQEVSSSSETVVDINASSTEQQIEIPLIIESTSTDGLLNQETVNTQETIEGDLLENTVNPNSEEASTTVTSTELILETPEDNGGDVSTSTEEIIATSTEEIATTTDIIEEVQNTEEQPVIETEFMKEQERIRVENYNKINHGVLATFGMNDLKPRTKFSVNIRNLEKIATKHTERMVGKKKVLVPDMTSDRSMTQFDSNTGAISVSGTCNAKYYVILLYKNQNDYAENKGSYIINKAYDCVNNSYSYSISDLPENLKNGTYYLLVGEMGEVGTWAPITALTPIDINRN